MKSLPGAMLYIPVENDNTPVSLKRSLSDPEIYFPSAVRHSLIVAVNGIMPPDKISSSSSSTHRINQDRSLGSCQLSIQESSRVQQRGGLETLQIDINVIQPTPNISPSHSLRSMSAESRDVDPEAGGDNFAGIPFLIVPPSPVRIRRVSFSDTSIDNADEEDEMISLAEINPEISITGAAADNSPSSSTTAKRRSRCVRQASLQVRDDTIL